MTTQELNRMTIDEINARMARMGFTVGRPITTRNAAARGGWLTSYPVTDAHGASKTLTAQQIKELVWLSAE